LLVLVRGLAATARSAGGGRLAVWLGWVAAHSSRAIKKKNGRAFCELERGVDSAMSGRADPNGGAAREAGAVPCLPPW